MQRGDPLHRRLGYTIAFLLLCEVTTLSRSGVLGLLVGALVLSIPYRRYIWTRALIAPLVAVLASATCPFNGQVFSVYGGTVGIYGGWSIADSVQTDYRWTAETLALAMDKLPRTVEVNSQMTELAKHMGRSLARLPRVGE